MITFVGSSNGASGNLTLTGVQEGDACLMFVYRDGSTNALPNGTAAWLDGGGGGNNFQVGRLYLHIVTADEGAAGTTTSDLNWTGITAATTVVLVAYRGVAGIGTPVMTGASSTTITYPALTLDVTGGTSMVVAIAGHRSVNTALQTPPLGLANRLSVLDATDHVVVHDGFRSAWDGDSVAVGGTASGYRTAVLELVANTAPPAGALRRWNGTEWVDAELLRWDGADWVPASLWRWNGSEWVAV